MTMSCGEARSLVSDYIDGELPTSLVHSLEGHLETCPNCPPLYASLVGTLAELKTLADPPGAEELAHRLVTELGGCVDFDDPRPGWME